MTFKRINQKRYYKQSFFKDILNHGTQYYIKVSDLINILGYAEPYKNDYPNKSYLWYFKSINDKEEASLFNIFSEWEFSAKEYYTLDKDLYIPFIICAEDEKLWEEFYNFINSFGIINHDIDNHPDLQLEWDDFFIKPKVCELS